MEQGDLNVVAVPDSDGKVQCCCAALPVRERERGFGLGLSSLINGCDAARPVCVCVWVCEMETERQPEKESERATERKRPQFRIRSQDLELRAERCHSRY